MVLNKLLFYKNHIQSAFIFMIAIMAVLLSTFSDVMEMQPNEDPSVLIQGAQDLVNETRDSYNQQLAVLHEVFRELCGFQNIGGDSLNLNQNQMEVFSNTTAHACEGCSETSSNGGDIGITFNCVTLENGNIHLIESNEPDPLRAIHDRLNATNVASNELNLISERVKQTGTLSPSDKASLDSLEGNFYTRLQESNSVIEFYKNELNINRNQ